MNLKVGILTEIIKIEVHLFSSILQTALFLSFQQREKIIRELENSDGTSILASITHVVEDRE